MPRSTVLAPFFSVLAAAVVSLAIIGSARAERPSAAKLLPRETVAYLRIADAPRLAEAFRQTNLGRMSDDPKMKPLVEGLWGTVVKELGRFEEELGVAIPELLKIPQGEFAAALIAPEEGIPSPVVLMDCGSHVTTAQKLIDRGIEAVKQQGAVESSETYQDTKLTTFELPGGRRRSVTYFKKDGTVVIGTRLDVLKRLIAVWNGEKAETLSGNERFVAIMNRCRGAKTETPQITWFVDPITAAQQFAKNVPQAQVGLALLPTLGLDGLHGVGGSFALATENYDFVSHLHVLIDNPRTGVMDIIALQTGDTTPEPWVPDDVARYVTVHWNPQKTYREIERLVDSLQGEGAVAGRIKRGFNDRLDVDFQKDVLDALDGRFTYTTRFDRPVRVDSQAHLLAVKLKDGAAFTKVLEKMLDRTGANLSKKTFAGTTYHYEPGRAGDDGRMPPSTSRPAVCILGDYLLVTNRASILEKAVVTSRDPARSLARSLEYQLIAGKIRRAAGGEPSMITFEQPEEGMRFLYDLVASDQTRDALARQAETNDFFKGIQGTLTDNPLPPFAVLSKYLAPGGSVLTDDDTGIHYMSFSLRRK